MSTLSDKLTYLNETKQKLKDGLNKFGAELTENDTFRSYSNVLNGIYDKLPRVTGNGSSFTLEDAQNGYLDDFKMFGNTKQTPSILPSGYTQVEYLESTGTQYIDTGININTTTSRYETKINPSSVSDTIGIFGTRNSSTANQSSMNVFIIEGTFRLDWLNGAMGSSVRNISSNTEYTISITRGLATINNVDYVSGENTSIDGSYTFYVGSFNNAGSVYSNGFSGKIYYSKLYNNNILVFDGVPCYRNSDNEIGMYDLISNTFFTNQGTGTFTYGSVVSIPNPDNPQDIRVVTGNNSVNVIGKNLFDKNNLNYIAGYLTVNGNKIESSSRTDTYYIECNPNTTYTLQREKVKTSGQVFRFASYSEVPTYNNQFTGIVGGLTDDLTLTITTGANDKYLAFSMGNVLHTDTEYIDKVQIEQGSSATTYEPYHNQTYPINLGTMELCKIGDYQDYIYKENNKWYLEKNVGKETNDGSIDEHWGKLNREINGYYGFRHNGSYSEILLCDKLTDYTAAQLYNGIGEGIGFSDTGSYLAVYIKSERVNSYDVTDLRTFLANNPITYYYQLSTPTTTEITDTTLISQLNAIETYTGTNIFEVSNSNDVLPTINVERLKELDKLS